MQETPDLDTFTYFVAGAVVAGVAAAAAACFTTGCIFPFVYKQGDEGGTCRRSSTNWTSRFVF